MDQIKKNIPWRASLEYIEYFNMKIDWFGLSFALKQLTTKIGRNTLHDYMYPNSTIKMAIHHPIFLKTIGYKNSCDLSTY